MKAVALAVALAVGPFLPALLALAWLTYQAVLLLPLARAEAQAARTEPHTLRLVKP